MSRTFASLSQPNYRMWFAAALVANIGTWMQRVAQDWLVLTVLSDDSGLAVGVVTGLQFLPALLLSVWGGVLADRVDRRKLLIVTQSAMGLLAFGLGALVLTGTAQLWHVYVFALLLGCASAIDGPVRQTFVAELVPGEMLPNAVGLNSASFNAARLVGPGLAGLLIAGVGSGWVFMINGLSFGATIIAMLLLRTERMYPIARAQQDQSSIRDAITYLKGRSDLQVIMIVVCIVSTFGLNFQLTSAVMARTVFDRGAGEYGVLGSVLAIGSLLGALLAARRKSPRVRTVVLAAAGFTVATAVMAAMPTYLLFAIASIPVGFFSLTMLTSANAAIQMSTSPQMRGRVMSIYLMLFLGATPIGSPLVGWVAEVAGARWSIWVGSLSALAVTTWAVLWTRKHWDYHIAYSLRRPMVTVVYDDERTALEPSLLAVEQIAEPQRGSASARRDPLGDVVDAEREAFDIGRFDGREQGDPQLVAAERAVGIDVDDSGAAQRPGDDARVDAVGEVDGGHHVRPGGRVGDERRRVRGPRGPVVKNRR